MFSLTFLRGRLLGPKRWLHRRFVARTAMRPFTLAVASLRLRRTLGRDSPPAAVATQLTRGWGNPLYAASPELVETVIREVRRRQGPVLECGSGVTTVVLATARRCFGTEVLSLEHERTWADAVRRRLRWLLLPCDHVVHRPLERRGSHDWYAVDESELPETVALVVCDGPPAATSGGRRGVLSLLERPAPPLTVILDDADRPDEAELSRELQARGYVRDPESEREGGKHHVLRLRGQSTTTAH